VKTFEEFLNEKIISYVMAQPTRVFDPSGKVIHLKKKQAMAKRSSSSAGD
jgi:hypothetical protein